MTLGELRPKLKKNVLLTFTFDKSDNGIWLDIEDIPQECEHIEVLSYEYEWDDSDGRGISEHYHIHLNATYDDVFIHLPVTL